MIEKEYIVVIAGSSGYEITKEVQKKGYKVLLIGGRKNDYGSKIADVFFNIDLREKQKIYEKIKEKNITKLILGTGHIFALELAIFLKKKGIELSINLEASLIAKDKYLFKKKLEELNFYTPRYLIFKSKDDINLEKIFSNLKFPLVIKATLDKTLPKKANNKEELMSYIEIMKKLDTPYIIEEYIEGVEVTVPIVSNPKDTRAILVSYYNKAKYTKLEGFFKNNEEYKLDELKEKELLEYSEKIIKKMNIWGVSRLDIIVGKDGKNYVLECNSIIVTGVYYGMDKEYIEKFLKVSDVNFAELTVTNALEIFKK